MYSVLGSGSGSGASECFGVCGSLHGRDWAQCGGGAIRARTGRVEDELAGSEPDASPSYMFADYGGVRGTRGHGERSSGFAASHQCSSFTPFDPRCIALTPQRAFEPIAPAEAMTHTCTIKVARESIPVVDHR